MRMRTAFPDAVAIATTLPVAMAGVLGANNARADEDIAKTDEDVTPPVEERPIGHEDSEEHESKRALPCRPTIACTADIVAPGDLEVESGINTKKQRDGITFTTPLLVKYSLSHAVQFQLGGNMLDAVRTPLRTTYLDNVVGTLKMHIVDQSAKRPALALSGGLSVPTFRADGYNRAWDGVFIAYVTKDVGTVHLDFNAGVNALAFDSVATGQGFVALAASTMLTEQFGLMGETYYFSDALPFTRHDAGFLFAFQHSPAPWLIFDVGGDVSYFPSTRHFSTFVGATFIPVAFGHH